MKIIGIDLGTSNSAAAVMINDDLKIIPSAEGLEKYGKMFPSVITFTEDGKVIVGKDAKRLMHPDRTVTNIKRKMGADYKIRIGNKWYIPQELSAMILKKIKKDAEAYLGERIKKAVITCPAYFNDNQRTATRDAGIIAGLDVVRIINEPTAASLAYGIDKSKKKLNIAVVDLGGGTLDVTILEMRDRVFKVIATSGDTQLGGIDMDNRILEYIIERLGGNGIDLKDKNFIQLLRNEAEKAKIELSTKSSTSINLPSINLNMTLTREKLEELIEDLLYKMHIPLNQALVDANLSPKDIDKVILVGGPTKMPIVRKKVEEFFCRAPERGVDPMHCVAIGAAIQASLLSGELRDIALLDVTPLSLGIETSGAVLTKLINRNTTIPVEASRVFTTAQDFQKVVPIHVLQGERTLAHDNITLGIFNLTGIRPAPRHEPMIEVIFKIDANGILHVSAEDLETGKKQAVKITDSTRLPKEEINRIIREAAIFSDFDKKKAIEKSYRIRAEALVYEVEKIIKKSHIEKKEIEELIKKLRDALRCSDINKIKNYTDRLSELVDETAKKMRVEKQANALMSFANEIMKEIDEKVEIERHLKKLKDALKSSNTKKIEEQIGKLSDELAILEIDYKYKK
ncbi:MAG: molecular chaperone DnaK [Candidatus Thermoplasmatota archaeon]